MANLKKSQNLLYHVIYKTINTVNNHEYIGAHSTNNLDDNYLGSGKLLNLAIKKYGVSKFKRVILFSFSTPEEMFKKEKELVTEEYISNPNVYNIVTGGFGGFNKGSLGLKHITNNDTNEVMAVSKEKLTEFLNNGWTLGGKSAANKGKVYIFKEGKRLAINKDKLLIYQKNGWNLGYEQSPTKGKIWIYSPDQDKYSLCNSDDLETYIKDGWIQKKWSPVKKGTIWINNSKINKRIDPLLFSNYEKTGWTKGRI